MRPMVRGFSETHLASKYYLGRIFWVKMTLLVFEMVGLGQTHG